jgi:hypothetical protein
MRLFYVRYQGNVQQTMYRIGMTSSGMVFMPSLIYEGRLK